MKCLSSLSSVRQVFSPPRGQRAGGRRGAARARCSVGAGSGPRLRLRVDTVRSPSVLGFAGNLLRQQEQQGREEEQVFQSLPPRGVSVAGGRGGDRDKIWSTRDSPSRTLFVRDRFLPVHRLLGSGQLQGLQQAADIQKEQVRVPWLGKRGDQFHIRLQTQGIANNLAHVKSPLTIVKARFGNGVSPHGDVVCHAGDRRAESRFR